MKENDNSLIFQLLEQLKEKDNQIRFLQEVIKVYARERSERK